MARWPAVPPSAHAGTGTAHAPVSCTRTQEGAGGETKWLGDGSDGGRVEEVGEEVGEGISGEGVGNNLDHVSSCQSCALVESCKLELRCACIWYKYLCLHLVVHANCWT